MEKIVQKVRLLIFIIALHGLIPLPCMAQAQESSATSGDAKAVLNTLKYIRGLKHKKGDVVIGVLSGVQDSATDTQARKTAQELESQKNILKNIQIRAVITTYEELQKGLLPDIILIPEQLSPLYPQLRELSQKSRILPMSLDASCAREQTCAIGIETGSGVEIYLNEQVLSACGYDVDAAFRYMAIRL